jgi:hypothetical protein
MTLYNYYIFFDIISELSKAFLQILSIYSVNCFCRNILKILHFNCGILAGVLLNLLSYQPIWMKFPLVCWHSKYILIACVCHLTYRMCIKWGLFCCLKMCTNIFCSLSPSTELCANSFSSLPFSTVLYLEENQSASFVYFRVCLELFV